MTHGFRPCMPDMRRAKAVPKGGCPHPVWCVERGECYYGNQPGEVVKFKPRNETAGRSERQPHKVMTPEEYAATPIVDWHEVCRNVDGAGGVGVRYLGHSGS